jgi:hypothetical protein
MNAIAKIPATACALGLMLSMISTASAVQYSLTIDGTNAIFLAGRTDVVIPAANLPWTGPAGSFLIRHAGPTPEEALETFPPFIPVIGGDIVKVADPAVGGIDFFNGTGIFYGPGGNGLEGSNLSSLGGISGYKGPQGPLAGVFLDDAIPNGIAPAPLDFTPLGLGTDFTALSPGLGQVFYIGDGVTSADVFQEFTAPPEPPACSSAFLTGLDLWAAREPMMTTTVVTG